MAEFPLTPLASFGISRERVRQIEAVAFEKVQKAALAACKRSPHSATVQQLKARAAASTQSNDRACNGATMVLSGNFIAAAA